MTLSLRARLTLWYTLTLLGILLLFATGLLWQQDRLGRQRIERELEALTSTVTNLAQEEFEEDPTFASVPTDVLTTIDAPGRAIALIDAAGRVLAARWNRLAPMAVLPLPPGAGPWTVQTGGVAWRVHARHQTFGHRDVTVITAAPLSEIEREQAVLRQAMVLGIPAAVLLAGIGGLWLAAVGLRPISAMARRAASIPPGGEEDLGEPARRDELGVLALAFNGLVARLRSAIGSQRQFMADASHELRTPVSVVRTTAEVMLSRDHREEPEYREALTVVGDQARRLGRLGEDMLVLARADAGAYPLRAVDLYLEDVIADCRRTLDVLAAQRQVEIRVADLPEMPFHGDEDLLRQLVLNVMQNAVQHSRPGGAVTVSTVRDGAVIRIRIGDTGPGIADAARQRIFDRFVQLDPSRRGEGTGLGLPIAKWIAEAHGGTLALESTGAHGSVFCLTLPLGTADAEPTASR
jgi:signal transduction histidine kinase